MPPAAAAGGGAGILIGQVVAGLLGPRMGWRAAFLLVALPGVLSSLLTLTYITEPMRGQSEKAIAVRRGAEEEAGGGKRRRIGRLW